MTQNIHRNKCNMTEDIEKKHIKLQTPKCQALRVKLNETAIQIVLIIGITISYINMHLH